MEGEKGLEVAVLAVADDVEPARLAQGLQRLLKSRIQRAANPLKLPDLRVAALVHDGVPRGRVHAGEQPFADLRHGQSHQRLFFRLGDPQADLGMPREHGVPHREGLPRGVPKRPVQVKYHRAHGMRLLYVFRE